MRWNTRSSSNCKTAISWRHPRLKCWKLRGTNAQTVYLAFNSVWTAGPNVRGSLVNYSATNLSTLDSLISQGFVLLLPQNGSNHVTTGANTWAGNGYVQLGSSGGGRSMGMIIGGAYNGGYDSIPTATVNTGDVSRSGDVQPTFINPAPVTAPPTTSGDPVNMTDGTFQLSGGADLSIGQAEPRGIALDSLLQVIRNFATIISQEWPTVGCTATTIIWLL